MFPENYFNDDAIEENEQYQKFIKTRLIEYLKDEKELKRDIRHVLRLAAYNGHAKYLKHLFDKYRSLITIEDVKHDNNCLLMGAGLGGHIDVLDLSIKTFDLTIDDLRARNNHVLRYAHYLDLTDLMEYLCKNYPFTSDEIDRAVSYQNRTFIKRMIPDEE